MIFHLSAYTGRKDHAVLQASLQLHPLLVALIVDAGEYQDVENQQRATDGDRHAQRGGISAVLLSRVAALARPSHRPGVASRRRQDPRPVGQFARRFGFAVLLAVRLIPGRVHHEQTGIDGRRDGRR